MNKNLLFLLLFLLLLSSCFEERVVTVMLNVESIQIKNKISTIKVGDQYKFEAVYSPSTAGAPENYKWRTSNSIIAEVNSDGVMTAKKEGELKITLISEVFQNGVWKELSDEVSIVVSSVDAEGIKLNSESLEIMRTNTFTLTVSFLPLNAREKEIEWSSDNERVAKVVHGNVTAISIGEAIITAKIKDSDIKATCKVIVKPLELSGVKFEIDQVRLAVNESKVIKIIFEPVNADNKKVTYKSSNTSVVTVSEKGIVKGISKGNVIITAISEVGDCKTECMVEVVDVSDLVSVSGNISSITVGDSVSGVITTILNNYSAETIYVKRFNVVEGSGNIYYSIDINEHLGSLKNISHRFTFKDLYKPKFVYTYEYDGKEYESVYQ